MNAPSLYQLVADDVEKLERRLRAQGISGIAEMDHQQYLRSTLWKKIRSWVVARDGATCVACEAKYPGKSRRDYMEVHHRDYSLETLKGLRESMLVTLCPGCHHKVEHYPDQSKRTDLAEKDAELLRLQAVRQEVKHQGLLVDVEDVSTRRGYRYTLTYMGDPKLTEFTSLESLVGGAVWRLWSDNTDKFRLPIPCGNSKLHQKNGLGAIDRETNKRILVAKMINNVGIITAPRESGIDIPAFLTNYFDSQDGWRICYKGWM